MPVYWVYENWTMTAFVSTKVIALTATMGEVLNVPIQGKTANGMVRSKIELKYFS